MLPSRSEVTTLARVEPPVDPLPRADHLLDRAVADRVHADLETGVVPVSEEALQDLVVEGELTAARAVGVRIADRGRASAERAVRRQIAPDRAKAELDGLRHVHHAQDDLDRHGEIASVREQRLQVQGAELQGQRHLVHGRDAVARGAGGAGELQRLDRVLAPGGRRPPADQSVRRPGHDAGRAAMAVSRNAGGV